MTEQTNVRRHKWGDHLRFDHKIERACDYCGIVKVTRHEAGARGQPMHWTEFWRGMDRIVVERGTPPCEVAGDMDGAGAPKE